MIKIFVIFLLLIESILFADSILLKDKVIVIESFGSAVIGNGITVEDAKLFAITDAKRAALELAGTFIESNSTILNHIVQKDEIKTYTGSVLKTEILEEEKFISDNNFVLKVKIKAMIDTELLNKRIEDVRNDSDLKLMLESERKRNERLSTQVAVMRLSDYRKDLSNRLEATQFYNTGFSEYLDGNLDNSILNYSKAIELDTTYIDAFLGRGNSYLGSENYQEAIKDFSKAISLEPTSRKAHFRRGIAYSFGLSDFDKGISDFTRVISLDAEYPNAYLARGQSYMNKNEYSNAIFDFNTYLNIDKNPEEDVYILRGSAYFNIGENEKGIKDFYRYLEICDKNSWRKDDSKYLHVRASIKEMGYQLEDALSYYLEGEKYYNLKDYINAIDRLSKSVNCDGNFIDALTLRAKSYFLNKDYHKAIEDYNTIIQVRYSAAMFHDSALLFFNPNCSVDSLIVKNYEESKKDSIFFSKFDEEKFLEFAKIYNSRGLAFFELKEYVKALFDFNIALTLNSNLIEGYFNRGECFFELDQFDNGVNDFKLLEKVYKDSLDQDKQKKIKYYLKNKF